MRSPLKPPYRPVPPAARPRTIRWWFAAGIVGLSLILAWAPLNDAWRVNQAGILLNRYEISRDADLLRRAASLLEEAEGRHGASYWRTYGAVATHAPTERAYEALRQAHEQDELDRIGELWLAEVASATGHWDEANEAYARVDATNVLVERADEALEAGDRERARRWYRAAARSVSAHMERAESANGDPRPPEASAAPPTDVEEGRGSRAVSLLRIGRGLLTVEDPEEALPVLELAYSQMLYDPPGTREQQAIRFSLATALVALGPKEADAAGGSTSPAPDPRARVETLTIDALAVDQTGSAHEQAAEIYVLLGETSTAAAHYYQAIRLDPRLPDPYLRLADIQRATGYPWLARETLAKGHAALPADPDLATAWAVESYRTLPPAQALPNLEEAAETRSRDPYLFGYLGDTYREMGRLEDALEAYSEGLGRAPGAPALEPRLARLVAELERWPLP